MSHLPFLSASTDIKREAQLVTVLTLKHLEEGKGIKKSIYFSSFSIDIWTQITMIYHSKSHIINFGSYLYFSNLMFPRQTLMFFRNQVCVLMFLEYMQPGTCHIHAQYYKNESE